MPKAAPVQTNFTAGELSPRSFGRTDLARYKNGVKTLENWLPLRVGGITRRPGFRYVNEVKDSTKFTRMISFEFNVEQTYMQEFGGVDASGVAVGAADATDNYFTITGSDETATFLPSRRFTVSGSTANDGTYTTITSEVTGGDTLIYVTSITDATADGTITPHIGYVRFYRDEGQLESVADTPTEIDSPYDELDLPNVKYVQSNDVLFLSHPDYPPHQLTRTAGDDTQDATWSITEVSPQDGPYLDENKTATTLTSGAASGSTTLTSSTDLWSPSDIGRTVRLRDPDNETGWGTITNYSTAKIVTWSINPAGGEVAVTAETTWSLGAWSATTGFPAVVALGEERLWWAATASEPNTLYASELGNFSSYLPSSLLDGNSAIYHFHGIVAQINSEQLDAIRWMISDHGGMAVLTDSGLWMLRKLSDQLGPNGTITETPTFGYAIRKQNNDTVSALVQPRRAGKVILQLEKGERRLLQEAFQFQDDRVVGVDLTVLADHMNIAGITESAFQDRPEQRLWLAQSAGELISMTLDAEQQVVAWARHILGGGLDGSDQAKVESIATIREANEDQLWTVVRRTINGASKRYVEFMEQPFDYNIEQEDAFFVDSGLTLDDGKTITGASPTNPVVITAVAHGLSNADTVRIRDVKGMTELNGKSFSIGNVQTNTFTLLGEDGTANSTYISGGNANKEVTTVSGLTHLVGETVNVMVDGASHPPRVVNTDGEITLDMAASIVHVGLPIESLMTTMPITATTEGHDSRPSKMQVSQVFLIVERSSGGMMGTEGGEYNEIIYREAVDEMGVAVPLFTGFLDSGVI